MSKIHQCFFASLLNHAVQCSTIVWCDGSEKVLILLMLSSSSLSSNCSIAELLDSFGCLLLLLFCNIPNVSELSSFCYKLLQGIFRFFIIFCWCMQRTDGRLHHYHHPSLFFFTLFSFSFARLSNFLMPVPGFSFPKFRLSWYPCDSSILNHSAK